MLETIIIAFIAAKVKGYNLKPLFRSWEVYPVIGFEVIYIIMQLAIFTGNYSFIKFASIYKTLYLYSVLFLIFKYKLYVSAIIGSIFIFIGTGLNKIAIAANNGTMPVFPSLSYYTGYISQDAFSKVGDIHVLGNDVTNLKFLTDIIDIGYSVLSIGDIFIRFFVFVIIYCAIKHLNKTHFEVSTI